MNSQTQVNPEKKVLWDELLAHKLAVAMSVLPVTPNQITLMSLVITLITGLLFATGNAWALNIAALLFMVVRFLDHLDGELARVIHSESRFGYYFDWFVDTFSYVYLFLTLAIGFRNRMETSVLLVITSLAVSACLVNTVIGLYKERRKPPVPEPSFPVYAGFGIDDSLYLIGPITWMGYLFHFYLLSAVGAVIYTVYTATRFIQSAGG